MRGLRAAVSVIGLPGDNSAGVIAIQRIAPNMSLMKHFLMYGSLEPITMNHIDRMVKATGARAVAFGEKKAGMRSKLKLYFDVGLFLLRWGCKNFCGRHVLKAETSLATIMFLEGSLGLKKYM